jgi:hypothetical protein
MLSKIELPSAGVFLCPFLIEVNGLQYYGTRLSENISRREPKGYLLCLNVPVARTGTQEYLPEELGLPGGGERFLHHAAGSRTARRQSAGGWTNISGENGVGT